MSELISRAEAKMRGLPRYFTGKACKHGHVTSCYVNGGCIACTRERTRSYESKNVEKSKASRAISAKKYKQKNADKIAEQKRLHRAKNIEKLREQARLRYAANPQYRQRTAERTRLAFAALRALSELGIEV